MKKKQIIIFAIPSYNEAGTVGALTRVIDAGLSRYFKNAEAYIVNADNDSPDGTKRAFLETPTKHKKIYLTSRGKPRHLRGKGYHMRMVLRFAKKRKADAVGFIDGDVSSASPEWVRDLIRPVLWGYDQVLPIYLRNEYDGSITNHLVFPVLYGLLLTDIRQPLAGEIGLSRRAVNLFLSEKWYPSANHFGVDIYFVTQSIFKDLRLAQTFIGVKHHKPSAPKLDPMFIQVADSLIRQLARYRRAWGSENWQGRSAPLLKPFKKSYHVPELAFDYKYLKEGLLREIRTARPEIARLFKGSLGRELIRSFGAGAGGDVNLPQNLWARAVYEIISKRRVLSEKELFAFRAIFFARFLTFYEEMIEKTHREAERDIRRQAEIFRKLRHLALRLR